MLVEKNRMQYVLLGSLGNITKPLAKKLITAGHRVTIVSSNTERQAAIEALGAAAAFGKVEDTAFLSRTFAGADAVYTMVPPIYHVNDWKEYIHQIGKNFAAAIQSSGVKKVVNLSSIGANLPEGCGPVSGIHYEEQELNRLPGVDVLHLRPAYFYTNLLNSIGMIKNAGFLGNNFSADATLVMVHPADIAAVAADQLLHLNFSGSSVLYIADDEKTSRQITSALGAAIGRPDLPYVEFSDADALKGALDAGIPEELARNYVEMGAALRTGIMIADYQQNKVPLGPIKLEDFAKEFATVYAKA
jgi:uncharacterized protein YbjT (DUF2867 family)